MSPADPSDLSSQLELALVIPARNEADNITAVLDEWHTAMDQLGASSFRIIVVDDASTDETPAIVSAAAHRLAGIQIIRNLANLGHGRSVLKGYEAGLSGGAQWIMQVDGDGQCDPAFLAEFWNRRQGVQAIFGHRSSRDDGAARLFISRLARLITFAATATWVRDANVPYRLMRRDVLEHALAYVPAQFRLTNIALAVALQRTSAITWIAIHFRDRTGGTQSVKALRYISEGIRLTTDLLRMKLPARSRDKRL